MHFSTIILFLPLLATANIFNLFNRQQQIDCAEYSRIANFSIVGANATYRSAYLRVSPDGGFPARTPLDDAISQLPNFQFDSKINDECGNMTAIAIKDAATNFTHGQVLQFNIDAVQTGESVQIATNTLGMIILTMIVTAFI